MAPRNKPAAAIQDLLLPHHALTDEEMQLVETRVGQESFRALSAFRHREGLCHTDTTLKLIELAGRRASTMVTTVAAVASRHEWLAPLLGGFANTAVLYAEAARKNVRSYSVDELLKKGIPGDCIAVVISACAGVIDPLSEQAKAAEKGVAVSGEIAAANHAIAVLAIENGQVYAFDADPFRGRANPFFKIDIETFRNTVKPRLLLGVSAIPKTAEGREAP